MANQEVKFSNFYESTLAAGSGGLPTNVIVATLTAAPTSNGTSAISTPYYLVIDPDSASSREVVEVTAATGTSLTTIVRDKEGRYGAAGDATTAPNHAEGTVVRMSVVKEMFEDLHDRVDTIPSFPITLGTNTNGNYVTDVTAGNGLSKTSSASEGQTVDLQVDINGATDGTSITVSGANDLLLLYDADAGVVKKVKSNQVGGGGISSGRAMTLG
jgi:hypothetical protein